MRKFTALLLALAVALLLTGCSGGGSDSSNIPEGAEFNQADVDFATDMIQHHAQALSMVDLTDQREVSPELAALAGDIRMAQAPEIEQMSDWLISWDQPIPETVRDHANAHGDGEAHSNADMPGMMSAEEMGALEDAEGEAFEEMWLEMMIEHHEGAIEMAEAEESGGEFPDAVELAGTVIDSQQAEIDAMESMLDAMGQR